jgi:hypothetical protein
LAAVVILVGIALFLGMGPGFATIRGRVADVGHVRQIGPEVGGKVNDGVRELPPAVNRVFAIFERIGQEKGAGAPAGDHGVAAPVDDGWSDLPRNGKALDQLLVSMPKSGARVAVWLFRNTGCNPRDVFIPRTLRDQFIDLLQHMEKDLASCYQGWVNSYAAEFEAWVSTGNSVQADLTPFESQGRIGPVVGVSLGQMQERGLDMFSIRDGVVHGFSFQSSPGARATRDQQRFLELEYSLAVLNWFRSVGTLADEEVAALQESAFRFSAR